RRGQVRVQLIGERRSRDRRPPASKAMAPSIRAMPAKRTRGTVSVPVLGSGAVIWTPRTAVLGTAAVVVVVVGCSTTAPRTAGVDGAGQLAVVEAVASGALPLAAVSLAVLS